MDSMSTRSRLYQDILSVFENAVECVNLLEEAEGDQEVIEMVAEEKVSLQSSLDEMYDEVTVSLLEPLKYDDCAGATLEFRPGNQFCS